MDRIQIPATPRSPEVDFDFAAGRFRLAGESYPEDAAAFFGPLLQALRTYLAASSTDPIVFEVALVYFNSSSAKGLMNLFMPLEDAAEAGRSVTIRWFHAEGDETSPRPGRISRRTSPTHGSISSRPRRRGTDADEDQA